MSLKSSFLKIYANLPLGARAEIVAVVGSEPVTWNSARIEIENDTAVGRQILDQLVTIGILQNENQKNQPGS